MAFDTTAKYPGYIPNGIRRLDNLETNLRGEPKRVPGTNRSVLHGPVGKVGHHYNLVWAWFILAIAFIGGTATITIIFFGRH